MVNRLESIQDDLRDAAEEVATDRDNVEAVPGYFVLLALAGAGLRSASSCCLACCSEPNTRMTRARIDAGMLRPDS